MHCKIQSFSFSQASGASLTAQVTDLIGANSICFIGAQQIVRWPDARQMYEPITWLVL